MQVVMMEQMLYRSQVGCLENIHIPSDLVVDSCPQMVRTAQALILR
jgi:hypothetical protein